MGSYKEVKGDLIELAKDGEFHVVVQGCNCFNTMGAGIAVRFAEEYGADRFKMEHPDFRGDMNKLGTIDYEELHFSNWDKKYYRYPDEGDKVLHSIYVVNAYTQYHYGRDKVHLDYEALRLCFRKINSKFRMFSVILPQIGCGLAGGNWGIVKSIMKEEMKDVDVTVVIYEKG